MGAWRLTGRTAESHEIAAALTHAPCGALIEGEAGVGKTRLMRHALGREVRRGRTVRQVSATRSAATIPLGALGPILGAAPEDVTGRFGLMQFARSVLAHPDGPWIVGVDDAQWLDDISAVVLHQLAVEAALIPVLTVRSGEAVPDAITALWRDLDLPRIVLDPLSAGDIEQLLEGALGTRLDALSVTRLHAASGGNPMLLRELIDSGLSAGSVQGDGDAAVWNEQPVGRRLTDLVRGSLGRVGPEAQEALGYLTVCEPLDLSCLVELAGQDAVEAAEGGGLLTVSTGPGRRRVTLAHPLHGEVIKESMPVAEWVRRSAELARALAARGTATAAECLQVAVLAVDGEAEAAPGVLERAALHAAECLAFPLAERLGRALLQADPESLLANLVVANALAVEGKAAEAEEYFRQAMARARGEEEQALVATQHAPVVYWFRGDHERARRLLDEVDARRTDPAPTLRGLRAAFALFDADLEAAASWATPELAEVPMETVWRSSVLTFVDAFRDHPERALAHAQRSLQALGEVPGELTTLQFGAVDARGTALLVAGRATEAESVCREYHESVLALGNRPLAAIGATMRAEVALARGQLDTARRWFSESLAQAPVDLAGFRPRALVGLARVNAHAGRADDARRCLHSAEAAEPPLLPVLQTGQSLAAAWVLYSEGASTSAAEMAVAAAHAAFESGMTVQAAIAWQAALRMGETGIVDETIVCCDRGVSPIVRLTGLHARGVADADGAALTQVGDEFAALGLMLDAAEVTAAGATAYHARGLFARARGAAERARTYLQACQGARSQAVQSVADLPAALTRREREVARLAARGLHNRQVAEMLGISVRTVESHLERVYRKYGVPGRVELGEILRPTISETP